MSLGWFILIAVLALAGILVGSGYYFAWCMNRILTSKLREIEEIRSTGLQPSKRRLNVLMRFIKKTNLVEDEQVRTQIMDELKRIYEQKNGWR